MKRVFACGVFCLFLDKSQLRTEKSPWGFCLEPNCIGKEMVRMGSLTARTGKMVELEDDPASYWVSEKTFQGRTVKLRGGHTGCLIGMLISWLTIIPI